MSEANESQTVTKESNRRGVTEIEENSSALNRVLNLAILFVGIGTYSAVGFGLERAALFAPVKLTYFSIGAVVGIVGLLLWLMTR